MAEWPLPEVLRVAAWLAQWRVWKGRGALHLAPRAGDSRRAVAPSARCMHISPSCTTPEGVMSIAGTVCLDWLRPVHRDDQAVPIR